MPLPKKKIALGCSAFLIVLAVVLAGVGAWCHHLLFDRTAGEYFDSNGVKIHYTVEGNEKAETVVLIHGLAAQADINWRSPGVNDLLSPDFRVVAFDLRGHGLSDHPHQPSQYGLQTVEDVTRLMDHLKIDKAHIAGYSLGGFIAMKFAILHPERCISLAICASGWKDPESREPLRSPYKDDPDTRLPDDEKLYAKLMRQAMETTTATIQELSPAKAPVPNKAGILPTFDFTTMKGLRDFFGDQVVDRDAMRALKRGIAIISVTADDLKACKVPTLCIMGTRDGLKPYALDLKQALPQTELVLLPGANHITTAMNRQYKTTLQKFFLDHRTSK